jgi:hypothetical protein
MSAIQQAPQSSCWASHHNTYWVTSAGTGAALLGRTLGVPLLSDCANLSEVEGKLTWARRLFSDELDSLAGRLEAVHERACSEAAATPARPSSAPNVVQTGKAAGQ